MGILKNVIIIGVLWVVVICASFYLNYSSSVKEQGERAFSTAESFFQQIIITRKWNAIHGGLYVPVTEATQPNPYLKIKNRDLQIDESLTLTKINPAFMTRQISEISKNHNGIQFHITSLNPIRPENKATDIETKYLLHFESNPEGKGEFLENHQDSPYFFMAPLITEKACLSCHAEQGYKEGDVRGGISVTIPFKDKSFLFVLLLSHIGFGLLGLLGLALVAKKISNSYRIIKTQSIMDALTGIPNRRSFSESIPHAFDRSKRENEPLSVIICDIDYFKKYNDTYGHSAGDKCLREVAQKIQSSLNRPSDFCARYGGEEFIVILRDTALDGAMSIANRIRSGVEEMQITHIGSPPANVVTISLGVAVLEDRSMNSYEKLIQYADKALYSAKESGRNQVKANSTS